MKSYVDTFLDSTCVPVRVSISKLNLVPNWIVAGVTFAVTPANVPATEIIAKVESAVRPLDAERADTVRRGVNPILKQAKFTEA